MAQELARVEPEHHISEIEMQIRTTPTDPSLRWALFQWLCVMQMWNRAVQQLQVYAQLQGAQAAMVHACRDLVRAERWRARVMAGDAEPGLLIEDEPDWMRGMVSALSLGAKGQWEAADEVRERSLEEAPLVRGSSCDHNFEWITDSDSRLGPICEIITAGRYRWLSLADIKGWELAQPLNLIDLVWAPCTVTLTDGTAVHGFMPARYPDAGAAAGQEKSELLLGKRTVWQEKGRSGVFGAGRKTWTTSAGDASVFELASCVLGANVVGNGPAQVEALAGAHQ